MKSAPKTTASRTKSTAPAKKASKKAPSRRPAMATLTKKAKELSEKISRKVPREFGKELATRFGQQFSRNVEQGLAEKATKKAAQGLADAITKALTEKPAATSALKAAPSFQAMSDSGEKISLSQFRGKKVILYFYPKDDTPGCTQESCDFRDSFSRLTRSGVVVLGVSKDSVQSHVKFKKKYSLPFPLLSDEDTSIAQAYGVWKEKSNYGRQYMGIERTTFLIDVGANGKGKILKVYPKVKVNGHVGEILTDLAALKSGK